jgi:acyl-CoA synthetase (NDP forming)
MGAAKVETSKLAKQLRKVFHPGSIAVVGASSRTDNPGTMLLRAIIEMEFEGPLYPVNPKHGEILGLKCYPAIKEIPSPPDLVILAVPPAAVPSVIVECVETGVVACVISTAGFSESGSSEGAALEQEILHAIKDSPLRLVGPNCLGIYSSSGKVALFGGMRPGEGKVSCVSQSGSIGSMLYLLGAERAVSFSKIVSSGNELDLNCADFLDYFAGDPETEMIMAYLEEVRDARRFLEIASRIKGKKPLLIWKAGLTERGRSAAASHTGAVAGSEEIWRAAAKQAGIVAIDDLADAVETMAIFYHLSRPRGRRICVISPPGGIAVNSADSAEKNNLLLPSLGETTLERLEQILPREGTSFTNPVDMGFGAVVPGNLREVVKTAASDENVDMLMVVGGAPAYRKGDLGLLKMHTAEIKEAFQAVEKPVVVIGIPSGFAFPYMAELHWAGIPCFLSPNAACRALSKFLSFHGLLDS